MREFHTFDILLYIVDVTDFLVFSKVNAIQFHNVTLNNPLAAAPYPDLSDKNRTVNVIALATDTDRKRIYYSDIQRKTISSMFYNGTGFMDVLTSMSTNVLYYGYHS